MRSHFKKLPHIATTLRACGSFWQVLDHLVEACTGQASLAPPPSRDTSSSFSLLNNNFQLSSSDREEHQHPLFATKLITMPFLSFQRPLIKDGYLLGEQSDDDSSDIFEKRRAILPERWSSIPRLLLICATVTSCYSILITALFTRHLVRSKYEGPDIIFSNFCENAQPFLG